MYDCILLPILILLSCMNVTFKTMYLCICANSRLAVLIFNHGANVMNDTFVITQVDMLISKNNKQVDILLSKNHTYLSTIVRTYIRTYIP